MKTAQPEPAPSTGLLLDQFLPRYDYSIAHARIFPYPPAECYQAARRVDMRREPIVRVLFGLRSLPQRLVRGRRDAAEASPPTFRLDDMIGAPLNWTLLAEKPGVEIVLGQIGRPWRTTEVPNAPTGTPAGFVAFDQPGFARIAFNLRVEPYGLQSSVLTVETRVALTDPQSIRRFARYWRVVGPGSELIRKLALRQLAADLRQSHRPTPGDGIRQGDEPSLSRLERLRLRVEHEVDTRSVGFAAWIIRATRGGVVRLWHRRVLLLTTKGRKTGQDRTVPLQYFPDGGDMVIVAANSGLPSPPGWYFNLMADPHARVEVEGRSVAVRAEELSPDTAAAFWTHVLEAAPDYRRFPQRTSRRIPLVRLIPESTAGT